jgi:uncharacterized integral membrane protein (TIGR00698 family)
LRNNGRTTHDIILLVAFIAIATGFISPALGLVIGIVFGLTLTHSYRSIASRSSRVLLQASVVALGFGMNVRDIMHAGRSGFVYTGATIIATMFLGMGLGRFMGLAATGSFLTSAGTAICGGSAIAAMGPIVKATDEEMAMSLGTVFLLNSVALLVFPALGWMLHLNQEQFGLWSALAIHDTSSVVGAATKYGSAALAVATAVKLARALWIVPLSALTAVVKKSRTRIQWPWFILFFCLATVARAYLPAFAPAYAVLNRLGKTGLTVTLYLIGTGLSKDTFREVGAWPLVHGLVLWALVAASSIVLIRVGWIHI